MRLRADINRRSCVRILDLDLGLGHLRPDLQLQPAGRLNESNELWPWPPWPHMLAPQRRQTMQLLKAGPALIFCEQKIKFSQPKLASFDILRAKDSQRQISRSVAMSCMPIIYINMQHLVKSFYFSACPLEHNLQKWSYSRISVFSCRPLGGNLRLPAPGKWPISHCVAVTCPSCSYFNGHPLLDHRRSSGVEQFQNQSKPRIPMTRGPQDLSRLT